MENNKSSKRRKWLINEDNSLIKTGKYSSDEEEMIKKALCEYALNNNLSSEDLHKLFIEKQKAKKLWSNFAELIPNRRVISIHGYCHRKFDPFNHKGKWNKNEEKLLLELVKEKGKKWSEISKILKRTPINCKDKYKSLGGDYHIAVQKVHKLKYDLKLLKAINNYLKDIEFEDNILRGEYKFEENVKLKYNQNIFYDKQNNLFLIENNIKDSLNKKLNKQIILQIININGLKEFNRENIRVSWKSISSKILCYSEESCKNSWRRILNYCIPKIIFKINKTKKNKENKKENIKDLYNNYLNKKRNR